MDSSENTSVKSNRRTKFDSTQSCNSANSEKTASGLSKGKRLKKDDSGINVVLDSDISDDSEGGATAKCEAEAYENSRCELHSPDSGNLESSSFTDMEQQPSSEKNSKVAENAESLKAKENESEEVEPMDAEPENNENGASCGQVVENSIEESSGVDPVENGDIDDDEDDDSVMKEEDKKKYDPTPQTPLPVHKWSIPKSVISRQYGLSANYQPDLFRYNCYGSLHMVERLELMYKMKKHDGCVNALNFNIGGTKLVSGSDDLDIVIWDWTISEPLLVYESGHRSNVFQAKFMPLSGDLLVVSCARDGQVRIGELSSAGICKSTRKLAQHKGAAHKLAIQVDSPHTFLSCGEDAVVFALDLRKESPEKLVVCKENEKKVPLYSIFINPYKSYEYVVGGRNQYVKVYDTRFLNQNDGFLKQYCPEHLEYSDLKVNVTSVVYNYNGTEILASYIDDDIYIFDSNESDTTKYLHSYKGHRNSQTVKGVNYFGSKSEFVVSGSDCGFIFFWDKETEHIVNYMYGDEGGVVNCLEPHPNMPVIATCGLDDDIKIWVPSCEELPDKSNLRNHLVTNMKEREEDRSRDCPDSFVDQTIWFLMQRLGRARGSRRPTLWSEGGDAASNSSSSDSDDDDSDLPHEMQCIQS